jgi:tricorn protease
MKKLSALIAFLFAFQFSYSQPDASWLRYASISPDGKTIVFTYKGDLYKVSSSGGNATVLTLHEAHDFMPIWSHDSKTIAFATDRNGNFDVYTISVNGGEAKRVTYHSAAEYPYEFSADNQFIYFGASRMDLSTNRMYPSNSLAELYKVSIHGGRVEQIITTPAEDIRWSKKGDFFIYQDNKGRENIWRKHQTSAVARDIWMYNNSTKEHKKITQFKGENRNPVLTNNDQSFYYLSEESGSFNVYKMSVNGTDKKQISNFKNHPVRFLSKSNNDLLCYNYNGDLYTLKEGESPNKLSVFISNDSKANNEKIIPVSGGIRDLALANNNKEVAYVFRGEVFVSSVEGNMNKRITNTIEQERSVGFSADNKKLVYASERNNKWGIYLAEMQRKEDPYFHASTIIKETPLIVNNNENYLPLFSPDGKEIAFIENRKALKVYNIESKQTRLILTGNELFSMGDHSHDFSWSPDGKWFLLNYNIPSIRNGEVGLISSDGKGKLINLTESGYADGGPKWVMGGKAMIWASNKDGLKSYAQSGSTQNDVYMMFFTKQGWDKFKLSKDEAALLKDIEEEKSKADTSKKKEVKKDSLFVFDWDGLTDRRARLTIHSSSLSDALVSKDGENLYYLSRFEKGFNIWNTHLRTKETKILAGLNSNSGGSMFWDKDSKNIFVLADGRISKIDPNSGKQTSVSIGGEMNIDVAAERAFMFEHVWRRTKTTFYTAGYHGADWDALKNNYEKFLPHIGNNFEFAEMLSELLGELNVSHSGASYNNFNPNGDVTASLGVFYNQNYKGNGVQIEEVIKDGPLDKAGFNIQSGAIIVAIDGEILSLQKDLPQYLNRKSGKNVLLQFVENGSTREIVIKAISLGEENQLLYKRWVKRNQEEVEKLSNGQLGYVHIPGMNDGAYRNVYDDVMGKYGTRKALVVDTRFNGGGDLVSDLAAFLTGKAYMENATDTYTESFEPTFRWLKPSIALANEANYSDGHCFTFMYQNLNIGKLVGMPTPGTCTYAGWEALPDNSIRWGVPPLGVKSMDGKYLENAQSEPDIKIMNEYHTVNKGIDQQLETAISELLKQIK